MEWAAGWSVSGARTRMNILMSLPQAMSWSFSTNLVSLRCTSCSACLLALSDTRVSGILGTGLHVFNKHVTIGVSVTFSPHIPFGPVLRFNGLSLGLTLCGLPC